jgi:PAS domain S-box-containing protein
MLPGALMEKAMDKEKLKPRSLRERAEALINKNAAEIRKMPPLDIKNLTEDLQIHQVELEIQNEELLRIQEELVAERNKYSELYDFAPVGYFTLSPKGMILEANLTAAAMLGMERGILVGSFFYDCITMDDRDSFYLFRRNLIENGSNQTCNLRLIHKNGSDFHAQMECIPVFDEKGNLDRVRAIAIDITKQYEAAERQRESDVRYGALFHNMKDGVAIYEARNEGKDFIFVDFNEAAEKIENIHKETLMGKSVLKVFPAVKEFGLYEVFKRVWKTGLPEKHPVAMYQDERITGWRENFVCKLPSGEILVVYSDETDRMQAEEALRKSEERFRTVADFTYDWEYWVAPDGHHVYVSPSCERITGHNPEAFLNDPGLLAKLVHPDDQKAFVSHADQMEQQKEAGAIDFRIVTRGGEVRWISHTCQSIYGSEGEYLGKRASNRDISKRKRMEEALRQTQKMESIATLTGGIAHDYNNLLSIIMGNLSLAMEEAKPGSLLSDFLNETNLASRKVRDLTHELMSLSRGGAPVKELGSLEKLLEKTSRLIPADSDIVPKQTISADLWQVPFDPYKMGAVFRNVVTNAVEAMPNGGILHIKAVNFPIEDPETVTDLTLMPGDYVHISIADQGAGIPHENLDKIFDPYFSTKPMGVQKGMGLGLATAYAIVQKHGGHIAIDSSPHVGTTLNIYLPAERPESAAQGTGRDDAGAPSTIAHQQTSIQRVLMMDDEEMLRNLVRQMLERTGYAVETVKDGLEAIEKYKRRKDSGEPFDAVILDLTIKGGMGGEQTIRELLKIDPDVKAIVSSGYFNDPVMSDFEKYGFMGALAKPYEKKALKEALERLSE